MTQQQQGQPGNPEAGTRSDTLTEAGAQPVESPQSGGGAALVGGLGGTDASAAARQSGSKGGPGGPSLREQADAAGVPGTLGGNVEAGAASPAAGAGAAGGTGLGETSTADYTRSGGGQSAGHQQT
jgi:hypothetical protein